MLSFKEQKQAQEQKPEQLKQKYLQFQLLQQQLEQLSQQSEALTQQLQELEVSQAALQQLENIPQNNEILATLAPGIFIKASLQNNQALIVNVGADTLVEKTCSQVLEMLENQKNELQEAVSQADALIQAFSQQALKLHQELEKLPPPADKTESD